MVRLGIVGFGRVAENHYAWALRALPNATVVWVADPDARALVAARRVLPGADGLNVMSHVGLARVDAVLVTAPPAEHVPLACTALAAGKAVYVEKPLALSLEGAAELVRVGRQSGGMGMTGYVGRFVPAYVRLKQALHAGHAGSVRRVRTWLTFDEPEPPEWKQSPAGGGGALRDIAVHHADLLSYLFESRVSAVRAVTSRRRAAGDTAAVTLELANGIRGECHFSSAGEGTDAIEVEGTRRTLHAYRRRRRSFRSVVGRLERGLARVRGTKAVEPAFIGIMAAFVKAVESGSPATPDLTDGQRGVAFFTAAEKSATLGEWVTVRDVEASENGAR